MNKALITFAFLLAFTLVIAGVGGAWYLQNKSYQSKKTAIDSKITSQTTSNASVAAAKDNNGYSPSDLVDNFLNEVKNGSPEKEKLYLATDQQSLDVETTLGFTNNLDQIIVSDTNYVLGNNSAQVKVKGFWPTQADPFEKSFYLIKENGLWKIETIKSV